MGAKTQWGHPPFLDYVDRWHNESGTIDQANVEAIQVYYPKANTWGGSGNAESAFSHDMWIKYRNNYLNSHR